MKFWRESKRTIWLVMLAAVMLIAAGCQAVGGLNLNQVLKQSIQVKSYEGSQSIEFKLLFDDSADQEGIPEIIKLLSNMKLELSDIRMKDEDHLSLTGKMKLDQRQIAFSLAADKSLAVLNIDGAKSPIVVDMSEMETLKSSYETETITGMGKQLMETLSGYLIDNLPNPDKLKVEPVQETVLGESLSLMHVEAQLSGKEIFDWINTFIDALLQDKAGLTNTLGVIYDLTQSQTSAIEAMGGENLFGTLVEDDKDTAVQEAVEQIREWMYDLRSELKEEEKNSDSFVQDLFNKKTFVKADVYVDSGLNIRKSVMELAVKPRISSEELSPMYPLAGIWVRAVTEMKNIHGEVELPAVSKPDKGISLEQLAEMNGFELLRQFDAKSGVYRLLYNDFHISKQQLILHPEYSGIPPVIIPSGITLLPLRDTVEGFGGSLKAAAKAKTITVKDPATAATIQLTKNSDQVYVNGKKQKWSFPVTVMNGVTYVPGRDLMKVLGGHMKWESWYEDEGRYLILEREPK